MIKAAFTPLCLTLLIGTAPILSAQQTPTDAAVQAALHREADRITVREKLDLGRAAEQRGDLGSAATLYGEAWKLIEGIGPARVPAEAQQTAAGVTRVRMELAKAAQR